MNTHWAITTGNHDSEADLTFEEISKLDRSYNMSLTKEGPQNISHAFNYMLPIYDKDGSDITLRLWFLDSGKFDCHGNYGNGCVNED